MWFVCGDFFREHADVDNTHYPPSSWSFSPSGVHSVFTKTENIPRLFESLSADGPRDLIIISHDSDHSPVWTQFFDHPRIVKWFAQNHVAPPHPRVVQIPIGIANRKWPHGSQEIMAVHVAKAFFSGNRLVHGMLQHHPQLKEKVLEIAGKLNLKSNENEGNAKRLQFPCVYAKFGLTHGSRLQLLELMKTAPWKEMYTAPTPVTDFDTYLGETRNCLFSLSPRGNGIDCVRTWECLYVGVIPVLLHSELDNLYDGLPVLLIDRWEQLCKERLELEWEKIQSREPASWSWHKLVPSFWLSEIVDHQRKLD